MRRVTIPATVAEKVFDDELTQKESARHVTRNARNPAASGRRLAGAFWHRPGCLIPGARQNAGIRHPLPGRRPSRSAGSCKIAAQLRRSPLVRGVQHPISDGLDRKAFQGRPE